MTEVTVSARPIDRFLPVVGAAHVASAGRAADSLRARLAGRCLWNVNSTASGGGVAEMLPELLAYARGAGCDARWAVIDGDPEFFRVTKRLHHALHGSRGDASALDAEARDVYDATTRRNLPAMLAAVRDGDVVILHDPQTAGLAPHLIDAGALVIWRSHIGHEIRHPEVEAGWAFLAPYLRRVPAFVFTRQAYVPDCCGHGRVTIITPSIDVFSAKNQDLDAATVRAILRQAGLVACGGNGGVPEFVRADGSVARVVRCAEVARVDGPPAWEIPLVVQVSRWDPLKDPLGVMSGFVELIRGGGAEHAELVLAGPDVAAVADDPEGAVVFRRVVDAWRGLPDAVRSRVHLVALPMADVEENAAIVNALQRHAAIVVQKSLQEGFGLTVTEAMWKARPVVASAVGGIRDQIAHGIHGLLIEDPTDGAAFASALRHLLADPAYASRLGENARARVRERFLGLDHLTKYARLIDRLDTLREAPRTADRDP